MLFAIYNSLSLSAINKRRQGKRQLISLSKFSKLAFWDLQSVQKQHEIYRSSLLN